MSSIGHAIGIAAALACSVAVAADTVPMTCPPASYPLNEVEIRLLDGGPGGRSQIEIHGSGEGHRNQYSQYALLNEYSFTVPAPEVVGLINQFLQKYFFDHRDSYDMPRFARLKPGGNVNTDFVADVGGASTTLTLKLGACVKACTFPSGGSPAELEELARDVRKLADARKLKP